MNFVELRRVNTDGTFVDLPDYSSLIFDDVWNPSPSSVTIEYPFTSGTAAGLTPGAFISVLLDGTYEIPTRFVIEKLDRVHVTDAGLVGTWSGRSLKALLEDDFVWPSAWPNPKPAGHAFIDVSAGTILKTFLTRSNQRGIMTALTHSTFTGQVDSSGATWTTIVDRNFANGQTVLQVLQNLYDAGMVEARTNGFALEVYKPNNLQRHLPISSVCFTAGDNISDESASIDATNFFTDVLMEGEENAQTATNTSTYNVLGRRRARYASVGGVSDTGTLNLLGSAELAQSTHLAMEQGLGVTHQAGKPQPFIDYRVGDWVWLDVGDGSAPIEIQVQQISVRLAQGKIPEVSLSLGDLLDDADAALKRKVDAITGGNSGNYGPIPGTTASTNLAPAAPTGLGATFGVYLDDKGINRVAGTFTWNPVSTNSDGTPASDVTNYELYMRDDSTSANWQMIGRTDGTVAFYSPMPEATYKRFIVYAIDADGVKSPASAEYRVQTPKDTSPPAVPSAPTAPAPVRGVVSVSWDGKDVGGVDMKSGDFAYAALYRSTTSNFALGAGTRVGTFTDKGTLTFSDQIYNQVYYYRLNSVDVSGNQSALSGQLSATTQPLVAADISNAILTDIDTALSNSQTATTTATDANNKADNLLNNLNTNYYTKTNVDTLISTSASGKNKNIYSVSDASGTSGYSDGDTWFKMSSLAAGGRVIAQWQFLSGAWVSRKVDGLVIANIDAASITTGFLDANRIQAGSLVIGQTAGLQPIIDNTQSAIVDVAPERINLAVDPAATRSGTFVTNAFVWQPNWYGSTGAGTTTLLTGIVGPVPEITTAMRKTWTTGSVAGDTGFGHSTRSGTAGFQVTPGQVYTASSWLRSSASGKTGSIRMMFYDATNTLISSLTSSLVNLTATWSRVSYTSVVPANATGVAVWSDVAGTPFVAGDTVDGTGLLVERSSLLNPYFDGSTPSTATRIYTWSGTAHNSLPKSTQIAVSTIQTTATNAQIAADAAEAINLNPSFSGWAGAVPDQWTAFGTGPTKETVLVRTPPNAARFNCTDTTTDRGLTTSGATALTQLPIGLQYVTVSVDVMLVSGTALDGAGVLLDWSGMGGTIRSQINLKSEIPTPVLGKWYRVSRVLARPTTATGTQTGWNSWLMGNYNGVAAFGNRTIKDVIFNRIAYRPSTVEEISAYNAAPSSTVTDLSAQVNSKGTDLVTNGTGALGTNFNFSALNYNGADAPTGATGSFVAKTTGGITAICDEYIPFDPTKTYRLSYQTRETIPGSVSKQYGFLSPYDASGNQITPAQYMWITGTTTTLAAALNPGDTTITLTSAANWYGQTGKTAGASTHYRSIIWWDYVDAFGKAWPIESYSRNTSGSDYWSDGGVDLATNTITLKAPYAGVARPIGTPLSNGSSGGTYVYMSTATLMTVPETWTVVSDIFKAGIMASGGGATGTPATWAGGLPQGTAKVKIGWLLNYSPSTGKQAVAAVSFSDAAAAKAAADAAQTTATTANNTANAVTTLTNGWKFTGKTTINGGAIEADSIKVAQLAAGTVGAKQLIVADTSNMAEINESAAGLVVYGGSTHILETVSGVVWSKRDVTTSQYLMFRNQVGPIGVKTGDRIRLTFEAFADATVTASPSLWTYLSNGSNSTSVTFSVAPTPAGGSAWPTQITTTPQTFAFEATAPAITNQAAYLIGLSSLTGRDVRVRNVRAYIMNAGELIVDGTIEGKALKANTVTATQIDASTLTISQSQVPNLITDIAKKTTTFAQGTTPTATSVGDLWINTSDNNRIYRASATGTGSWVLFSDLTPKTTTFAQGTIPTSLTIGDLWINTSDANKFYRAASAGATTIGSGAWVLVNSLYVTQTFAQGTVPTSVTIGDLWIDTTNQNKMYRASAAGATTIGAGAWILVQDPTAKTTTFAQSSIPTSAAVGDIWVDTANQNKFYRAAAIGATTIGAGAWVLVNDLTTKSTTFAQSGIPTSLAPGDFWIDTANQNKMYRAAVAGATTIGAGAWVIVQDPTAKTTTFAQGTIPTSITTGDIWINTSDSNKMYRSFASGVTTIGASGWVLINDPTAKTTTFAQGTIPVSTAAGDIWIDTANQNKMYRAVIAGSDAIVAGEWVLVQDTSLVSSKTTTFAQGTIPTSVTIGDLWVNTSDANKIYRAAAAGATTIAAGAWVLVNDLTTKTTTFAQGTVPTALTAGDFWVNTSDANKIYRAFAAGVNAIGASGWILVSDLTTKTTTFAQGATPTALAQGDFWINTSDSNKMYRAFNAGVNTIGASGWVLINDPTVKSTTFAQGTIPTSLAVGDFWVDTSNQNKMYRAAAIGATTIGAGAWVLVNDLTTKTTTYAQGTIPTSAAIGDIWVNTSDNNKMYRAAAIGATTIAAGQWVLVDSTYYTKTFAQSGIPTSLTAGDIWVDTANQNKIYRAFAANVSTIGASAWVLVQDPSAKTTTFAQPGPTPPTSAAVGDIWVNTTDGNKMYRAAAIGATTIAAGQWVLVQDITTKTSTFRQASIPTSLAAGDTWYDTDDNNRVYVAAVAGATTIAAGGWVEVTDYRINSWTSPGTTKIDGGQLQTNSVMANAIAARVIGTDKLLVGGVTNVVPNGAGEWNSIGGIFPVGTVGISYDAVDKPAILNGVFKTTAGKSTQAADSGPYMFWDVEQDQEFLVEVWAKADIANSVLYVDLVDQSGVRNINVAATTTAGDVFGGTMGDSGYPVGPLTVPTTWTRYSSIVKVLPGSTRLRVGTFSFNHSSGTVTTAVQSVAIRVRSRSTGLLLVDGTIEGKHIKTNSVAADRISTGQLAVDAEIVAGNPLSSHASVSGTGFRSFAVDADGVVREAVRMGTDTNDLFAITDATGSTKASINEDGIGSFTDLDVDNGSGTAAPSINGIPLLGTLGGNNFDVFDFNNDPASTGRDLEVDPLGHLETYAKGNATWMQFNATDLTQTGASNSFYSLFDLSFDLEPGRQYSVTVPPVFVQGSVSGGLIALVLYYTTNGTMPTTASQVLSRDYQSVNSAQYASVQIAGRLINGGQTVQSQVRILGVLYCNGTTMKILDGSTPYITDLGPTKKASGRVINALTGGTGTAPTTAPPKSYTKSYNSVGWGSYRSINAPVRGTNSANGDTGGHVYQGYSTASSYNGDQRGLWVFPSITGDIGTGTLNKVEIYLYANHWYYNNGGTARIALHNYSSVPLTSPSTWTSANWSPLLYSTGWPKPGGRWITLPSTTYASWKNGTWKGFGVGPVGTTSLTYYGYFSPLAQLRITYTK